METIHVLYKAPGMPPEPREIPNTLEELQASVGGRIETVTISTDCVIICNEEGRLLGMPYNCTFLGIDFVGPILFTGADDDKIVSLHPEEMGMLLHAMDGAREGRDTH